MTAGLSGSGDLFLVREPPGHGEDDAPGDLDGMVGEPLVEPSEQRDVDGGGHTVPPVPVHQHGEQVAVQVVHRIVFFTDPGGLLRIAGEKHLLGTVAQFDCHPAHFGEVAVDLFGQCMLRVPASGDLGDVQRQCAHPVDVGNDLNRADNGSQIAATGACNANSTNALSSARALIAVIRSWSVMTCSASTRSACRSACVARSIATPASPHISPSWPVKASSCSWYAVRMRPSLRGISAKRHDAIGERKVNATCLNVISRAVVTAYSHVVSAAFVTVRSSGRCVGAVLVSCTTWTCTGEPLGDGGVTE